MKTLNLLLLAALALALSWLPRTGAFAESAPIQKQWTVEGVTRQATLYVPANATREKTPVIFAFHGHGGSNGTFRAHILIFPKQNLAIAAIMNAGGESDPSPALQAALAVEKRYRK